MYGVFKAKQSSSHVPWMSSQRCYKVRTTKRRKFHSRVIPKPS